MSTTLAHIAELVGGTLSGDGNLEITGAAILRDAAAGQITLADRAELARELTASPAAAVLVPPEFSPEGVAFITVANVSGAFAKVITYFRPLRAKHHIGISSAAHVSPSAKLGAGVEVHPGATIGDDVTIGDRSVIHAGVHIMAGCQIAEDVTIFPGAVLYENTIVGPRCNLHAGCVLGAHGFGYDSSTGKHELSAQLGYVELAADVDVGACATIDRGTFGPTYIGEGTKIDNLVQIAHNVRIGKHNLICSLVGIAGSSTTGNYVVLAGQVGVRDHVNIGDGAILGAQAGVVNHVPAGETYLGSPATPMREQKVRFAAMTRLPELRKEIKEMQKQLQKLVEQQSQQQKFGQQDAA